MVTQSCLTLCDPVDGSPSGSSVPVILQARMLERVAIPFPRDLPHRGTEAQSPPLPVNPLPPEPPFSLILTTHFLLISFFFYHTIHHFIFKIPFRLYILGLMSHNELIMINLS